MVVETTLRSDIDEIMPGVVADRRYLHEHPELSFHEDETARFVADRLASLGLDDIRTGIGGTGVTALIHGGRGPGRVAMVRADMDALPIEEANEVDYASRTAGVMHACGHDAHTAMLLGLSRILMDRRDSFAGIVKVLFQPAEEVPPGGAIAMIEAGALDDPHVDAAFGLHVASEYPAGRIALRPGASMACGNIFSIHIHGKGGHAAHPYRAVDPVVVGSQVVIALQALVSRETDPVNTGVVSITAFMAGEAFNVIPDTAELRGTMRSLDDDILANLEKRTAAMCEGIGAAFGATIELDITPGYPVLVNDDDLTAIVRGAAVDVVGAENVIDMPPVMGGEDFARYCKVCPSVFFNVGVRNDDLGFNWPHHHPRFDLDEEGLGAGIATMAESVLRYLDQVNG